MSEQKYERREDHSTRTDSPSSNAEVHLPPDNSKLIAALVAVVTVCTMFSGLSLGVAFWALAWADKSRMEARVLQVKVEGFENALWAARIDPTPHLKGQPE